MKETATLFHGEWWVPARADHDIKMMFMQPEGMMGHERKYTGTLTYYGDKDSILSLYHVHRCHIDPIVLKDSRDKYSHLYPDEEESKAVEGEDLYWLTEKCKILLTCCILNMLGLTNSEINLCIEGSPIQNIIDSSPFEFEE